MKRGNLYAKNYKTAENNTRCKRIPHLKRNDRELFLKRQNRTLVRCSFLSVYHTLLGLSSSFGSLSADLRAQVFALWRICVIQQFFDYSFTCPCSIIYFANVCVQHLLQSGDILSIEFYAKWGYYIDREKQKPQPQKDI